MDKQIWRTTLSDRTKNLLQRKHIDTVNQLRRIAENGKLRSIYGIGVRIEAEILSFLEKEGQQPC